MKPLATFKLYPTYPKGRKYFIFNVWSSFKTMQSHVSWALLGKKTRGLASTYRLLKVKKNGKITYSNCLGEVNVLKRFLDIEVLVHELGHITLGYSRYKKLDLKTTYHFLDRYGVMKQDSGEEKFCRILGELTSQATYYLQKNKVWK